MFPGGGLFKTNEIFLIPLPPGQRRGGDSLYDETSFNRCLADHRQHLLVLGFVLNDASATNLTFSNLELRLDQGYDPAMIFP